MADFRRPRNRIGSLTTTPRAALMMELLGVGVTAGSVALTSTEFDAIKALYGFKPEEPNEKPPPPEPPKREDFEYDWKYEQAVEGHKKALKAHANWQDPRLLLQAGSDRNAVRAAETDGLRLLAWIAKYVPAGDDPLKTLVQMAIEAQWDIDPADYEWAESEE